MIKQPITIRIAYAVLKDLLHLPEDVDVLGVVGVNDLDGTIPLIVETPLKYIRCGAMTPLYHVEDSKTVFQGFVPHGLKP